MLFVSLGVLLIALKLLEIGAVANWSWIVVLAPFAAAVVWWAWADMSGYTRRKAMEKMDEKKVERRRKALSALGLDYRAFDKEKKRTEKFKEQQQKRVDKVESKREAERQRQRDSILHSRFQGSTHSVQGAEHTDASSKH